MGIRNLSDDIILVELASERAKRADELKTVNETLSNNCNCDVIIDFSSIEIINSWNVSNLLILRSLLQDAGRQLILCNVSTVTKCIFVVAGLSEVFVFVDNQPSALEAIKSANSPASAPS